MKPLIIIGIVIAALGGLAFIARPRSTASSLPSPMPVAAGSVTVSERSFDFGSISMAKGMVMKAITVRNTGGSAATLGKLYTSCMCTSASLALAGENYGPYGMEGMGYIPKIGKELPAGQEATITVMFDPNAHGPAGVGHIERVVTLEVDGDSPVTVDFSADVTP
jgi:hypothetical protein